MYKKKHLHVYFTHSLSAKQTLAVFPSHGLKSSLNWADHQESTVYLFLFWYNRSRPTKNHFTLNTLIFQKASDVTFRSALCSVLLSATGSGPPAWLRSRHPALGAQRRPGQPLQLGCGSLLHRLQPACLGLLQSHRHSLWQQVKKKKMRLPLLSDHLVKVFCQHRFFVLFCFFKFLMFHFIKFVSNEMHAVFGTGILFFYHSFKQNSCLK